MATTQTIIEAISKYLSTKDHKALPRESLLNQAFPDTFYPSALHTRVHDLINQKEALHETERFFVIQPCFRHIDISIVPYSGNHLSLFEMIASGCSLDASRYLKEQEIVKEEVIEQAWAVLTKELAISPNRLLVTVFGGGNIYGQKFEEDIISLNLWKKMGLNQIIFVPGTKNFLYIHKQGEASGPRCEIYVEIQQNSWLEVASSIFETHRISSKGYPIPALNCVCGNAFGAERLSVVVNGLQSIFDIDVIKPIIELLLDELGSDIRRHLFYKEIQNVADHVRAITFIIADGQKIDRSMRGERLKKLLRTTILILISIGIRPQILEALVDKCIEIYSFRYPELKGARALIESTIMSYLLTEV